MDFFLAKSIQSNNYFYIFVSIMFENHFLDKQCEGIIYKNACRDENEENLTKENIKRTIMNILLKQRKFVTL